MVTQPVNRVSKTRADKRQGIRFGQILIDGKPTGVSQ
jgi:hypothetical protein